MGNMRTSLLLLCASLALSPVAKADKFWLQIPGQGEAVEGSLPPVIEGVILDQTDTSYHLRVVGGELWLTKSQVLRVDKDAMTVASIEKAEQDNAADLVAATAERISTQRLAMAISSPAAIVRDAMVQNPRTAIDPRSIPRAATASGGAPVGPIEVGTTVNTAWVEPAEEVAIVQPISNFDPVIGRALMVGVSDYVLIRELTLAYSLSRDRDYVKMLRVMRRLR